MNDYQFKKQKLIHYLQIYLSKKLNMEFVLLGIIKKLKNNHKITIKQFRSILSYLEREPQFLKFNRTQIETYFLPIIQINNTTIKRSNYEPNTLTPFFQ